MSKSYKAFIKEYDMGLTVPSMSFLKPTASMRLKRKDELVKVREKWMKAKKKNKKQDGYLDWFKDRAKERTSLDGGALIVLSLVVLFAGPLVKLAATAGLIWGIVTLIKKG